VKTAAQKKTNKINQWRKSTRSVPKKYRNSRTVTTSFSASCARPTKST